MKVLLSSLNKLIDLSGLDPKKIAADITMGGLKVDAVEYLGHGFENVVTGKILNIEKHPNAEKLTICTLDTASEKLTIVCGAKNMSAGDVVPVAKIGAKLPCGLEIKEAALRGVKSFGMLCSEKELGLAVEASGLMLLDKNTAPGIGFADFLGKNDWVFDIDVTAQRGDAMSVLGVARDLAAIYEKKLVMPSYKVSEDKSKDASSAVGIKISAEDLCPSYLARVIDNVKIGPSPVWLRHALENIGMRPVNNVVDVTNYVTYMYGHPSHAFDFAKLSSPAIEIRRAKENETMKAIDNKTYQLSAEMLVISDPGGATAIAGVMGGLGTEVDESTTKLLIEMAVFNAVSIRKTSKKLGLASESSLRFTRGVDISDGEYVINVIASMICELCPSASCYSSIVSAGSAAVPVKTVEVSVEKLSEFSGQRFTQEDVMRVLNRLGFEVRVKGSAGIAVTVPSYRHDINLPCDIYEEFLRIYGYNNVAEVEINMPYSKPVDSTFDMVSKITDIFVKSGFYQCMNYSFIGREDLKKENYGSLDDSRLVKILNPLGVEFSIMRPSMLSGLLKTMQYNMNQKMNDVRFFEVGNVYRLDALDGREEKHTPLVTNENGSYRITERQMAAGLVSGMRENGYWNAGNARLDFYYLKGVLENLLEAFKIEAEFRPLSDIKNMHPRKTAGIYLKSGEFMGYCGALHPSTASNYGVDINKEVIVFELDASFLASGMKRSFKVKEISKFPASAYDLAVLISKDVTYSQIMKVCYAAGGKNLISVSPFDEYIGDKLPSGKKSVAVTLVFQSDEATLSDAETKKSFENIIAAIKEKLAGELRS